ncbi:acyl-CoA dehydrogenase family protein [Pseudonocardia tropica]|uniref:Acyl-CoA dehydrogenase family protein n=1 Tax=Pseudonocardia tropica TaxID=681289 RepID=A0ABV1JSC7_9PSEU
MPVTDAELHARFRPLFDEIAAGAVERELTRRLPDAEVAALRDAGFGAVRLSVEAGGAGASLRQLFALLVELGAADSNVPQALRTHLLFAELWSAGAAAGDPVLKERVARIAAGRLVATRSPSAAGSCATPRPRCCAARGTGCCSTARSSTAPARSTPISSTSSPSTSTARG